MTLRLRLTLLYGAVFVAAGAGLLAATYGLFRHSQDASGRTVAIRGVQFTLPAGAEFQAIVPGGAGSLHWAGNVVSGSIPAGPSLSGGRATKTNVHKRPSSSALLRQIQSSGQAQLLNLAERANVRLKREQASDASSLLEWSAIALGAVALLSISLAWWLAGRALRPLRTMNTRARKISAENLHERLGGNRRNDELGELGVTFDALLARLEVAFDSQRRFVANASHELRTPLTLERTLVEVALADPDASIETLRRVCERVVASTEQQERLLDALLTLARSEAGVAAGETFDLAALVEDALLARDGQFMGINVEAQLEPALVTGDRALLDRLVANLLDNAIVHNSGGEPWIHITTGDLDGAPALKIANSGGIFAPDQVVGLFEPFRRGNGERVGDGEGGLGLGLSIVRAVAVAHGARIEAHALPGGGLEFDLRFSSAPAVVGDRPDSVGAPI